MRNDALKPDRRSTRLSISLPVTISGVDAEGSKFSETVRTQIVNKHGAKISTPRHIAKGTEVMVESPALGVAAKATVVWLSEKHHGENLHYAGLQLHEPQNLWGIEFPPDDWSHEAREEPAPAPEATASPAPPPEAEPEAEPEAVVTSLAAEEITIRMLQELQQAADAHAEEFRDHLKQLIQRLGLEVEVDLRERVAHAKAHEVGVLEEEIRVLRESLRASREEIARLEARTQELRASLQATMDDLERPPTPLDEARRQLSVMADGVVERMNRAAEAGLNQYRALLQQELQESAARLRPAAKAPSPPPRGPARQP